MARLLVGALAEGEVVTPGQPALQLRWYPNSWIHLDTPHWSMAIDPAFLRTYFSNHPTTIEFSRWPDPIDGLPEPLDPVDVVLITHHHKDHCKLVTVSRLLKSSTIVAGPRSCRKEIGGDLEIVRAGDHLELGQARIDVVPAHNTPAGTSTRKQHRAGGGVGYIVELAGQRVYHAGDTDLIDEMASLGPVDVALLPIGGTFTMDPHEAVRAVAAIKPRVVVPMHRYGADVEAWANEVAVGAPGTRVEALGIGERLHLSR